ncbi:MAG TPA: methyltransferase domain-containing protein [Vicinamibacterales bacterium]|jgi:SAM-dependent methyltransferase
MAYEPLEARLARLAREREAADRAYNGALTAVDKGAIGDPALPAAPAEFDDHQTAALNQAWNTLTAPAPAAGLRGRLAAFVWRLVAPTLERQNAFNSRLVDHLNRNARAERETRAALVETLHALRGHFDALLAFQTRLLVCLQQITAYVDTKDRDAAGGALVVNAAVNALADESAKRRESAAAREDRMAARLDEIGAAQDDLRQMIAVAQQAALAVKRELQRTASAPTPQATAPNPQATPNPDNQASTPQRPSSSLDDYKYVGFEDRFRGSREVIRARLASYVPYFAGATDVLDVGCGRGEFLDLLRAAGIGARGIDLNHEMVEVCRAAGLSAEHADAVSYLSALPDGSLGGLFAAQVVEHLEPAYLLQFLELAHHKLRPGAPLVLETLNPACWVAFFESFIRDITHVWPLHPDTLRYLVTASGFVSARLEYRSPVPLQDTLQHVAPLAGLPEDAAEILNANADKLNARLFTFLDYAVVGVNA